MVKKVARKVAVKAKISLSTVELIGVIKVLDPVPSSSSTVDNV